MSGQKPKTELMARGAGAPIAFNAETGGAADWIMVMPAGKDGVIATVDTRGPYRARDLKKIADESLHAADGRLLVDENHATDLAAPLGGSSPARGWMTKFDVRPEGLFAHVEWNAAGAQLMSDRAYRYISPVFTHDKSNNVLQLLRASLTNTPNLRGMAALHAEEKVTMDMLAKLREMLGLPNDADEAAIMAKIGALKSADKKPDAAVATASALAPIAKALDVAISKDATAEQTSTAIQSAIDSLKSTVKPANEAVAALQSELKTVSTALSSLQSQTSKDKATSFVDAAIAAGVVGVKPLRDHYITMHAADPARVEKEINAMAKVPLGSVMPSALPDSEKIAVNMSDAKAIASAAQVYQAEQARLGISVPFDAAVTHIEQRAK